MCYVLAMWIAPLYVSSYAIDVADVCVIHGRVVDALGALRSTVYPKLERETAMPIDHLLGDAEDRLHRLCVNNSGALYTDVKGPDGDGMAALAQSNN